MNAMASPSGDHAGSVSDPACVTIACRPAPDAPIAQMSRAVPVALARSKAISSPSGDQLGCRAETPGGVSSMAPVPSDRIFQSVNSPPSVCRTNAICVPSGEYAGSSSACGSLVSITGAVPSGAILTTSSFPDAPDTTAMRPFSPAAEPGTAPAATSTAATIRPSENEDARGGMWSITAGEYDGDVLPMPPEILKKPSPGRQRCSAPTSVRLFAADNGPEDALPLDRALAIICRCGRFSRRFSPCSLP